MKRFIALVLSLIMALSLCAPAWAEGEVEQAATGGAVEVATADELAKALADAADAGSGDSTVSLTKDIDLTGTAWTPVSVDGYHGAGVVTVEGNGNKITGLSAPLFAGGFAGKSGIVINDLTIADSTVVCTSGLGGGAFIDSADSMHVITLDNCHLINSSVSGERAGGLIGWCSGYAKLNDGPVKAYVTITNCSVVNSTVTGAGSAGAIAGHPGASDYTYTAIENCIVKNVDVVSNETGSWRTGAIVGTANNGHVVINNVTVEDVTLTQNGVTAEETLLYGRFVPSGTGTLEIDGKLVGAVAEADGKQYMSLQAAVNAGGKVVLLDNITLAEGVTIPAGKTVELDLAGKIISGTDTTEKNFGLINIDPGATLTISDSVGTGVITLSATTNNGWNRYSSVVSNQRGTLTVNGGTLEHKGGTDMSYAIDNLTNTGAEEAKTVINGGVLKSSYIGIRQFCNSDKGENILEINNGTIEGARRSVWMQNPNSNKNLAKLTITNGFLKGDLTVGSADFAVAISGGYFTTDPSAYCADKLTGVASDKTGYLYMVGEKNTEIETPADVVVATPAPEVNVTTTNATEEAVVDELKKAESVEISTDALTAQAKDVANNTSAEATDDHAKVLNDAITGNAMPIDKDDVTIVVQPYFDVAVKDVAVETEGTGAETTVTSASITVNITPMYQTVATTKNVVENEQEIVLEKKDEDDVVNAVVLGEAKELTITEPVKITIAIPAALAIDDGEGGYKSLYVTHVKDNGTKYVYEAKVEKNGNDYTATFTNPNGFSLFTLSVENTTAAKVGNDSYADLQSAIDNAGKDATITVVKNGNHKATVKGETSFKLVLENGATATITAAPGYSVSENNGVYTVTKVTGGYYPYYPSTTPDSELVKSPDTFDAGIALYVGVSVMGAIGTVVLGKKRED